VILCGFGSRCGPDNKTSFATDAFQRKDGGVTCREEHCCHIDLLDDNADDFPTRITVQPPEARLTSTYRGTDADNQNALLADRI
jgi:hypothetical protein